MSTHEGTTLMESAAVEGALADQLEEMRRQLEEIGATTHRIRRQQEMVQELKEDLMPMANGMIHMTSEKLLELEREGALDDVKALGENLMPILALLNQVTQPEVLSLAGGAAGSLKTAGEAQPLGLMGVMKAMKDPEVKKGMGVMIHVLRSLGRAAG